MPKRIEMVRQEFVGLELSALQTLLDSWRNETTVKRRKKEWKKKLPVFRSAVSTKIKGGSKEGWPRELVMSEYWVAQESFKIVARRCPENEFKEIWALRNKLVFNLPTPNGGVLSFTRPFPAPKSFRRVTKNFPKGKVVNLNWNRKPQNLVKEIIGCRLGTSESTINNHLTASGKQANRLRFKPSPLQSHLASTFLDLCADHRRYQDCDLAYHVFNALKDSGFNKLGLYYLVQISHTLKYPLVASPHDEDEVRRLCEAAGN